MRSVFLSVALLSCAAFGQIRFYNNGTDGGVINSINCQTGTICSRSGQRLDIRGPYDGGVLDLARGGTSAALTATNGGLVYSGASALAITGAGTANQVVLSGGAGAPTFGPFFIYSQLRADETLSGASATTATKVSDLGISLAANLTYIVHYRFLAKSEAAGDGIGYSVEFDNAPHFFNCQRRLATTGTSDATGVANVTTNSATGNLVENFTSNTSANTADEMGVNTGGQSVANVYYYEQIDCYVKTNAAAGMSFWWMGESAGSYALEQGGVVYAFGF